MKKKRKISSPTTEEIVAARHNAELTQAQAGALLHTTGGVWRHWEYGDYAMHPALWELFSLKAKGKAGAKKINSPTPDQIRSARKSAGLLQIEAAAAVHVWLSCWTAWELGERRMRPPFWELFLLKVKT